MNLNQCYVGDCREGMRQMIAAGLKVQTCVTSPPYFGLRDYGHDGQLGLEESPELYIAVMLEVFALVHELLADDGTLWLNIGDSYATRGGANQTPHMGDIFQRRERGKQVVSRSKRMPAGGRWGGGNNPAGGAIKPKDLIGIPWMLAFALRAQGWYLRQDIVWQKPNPMPESVNDRCTKAHEYLFLLTKSERYHFDGAAIAEPLSAASIERLSQANLANLHGSDRVPSKTNGTMKAVMRSSGNKERKPGTARGCPEGTGSNVNGSIPWEGSTRNKRSVWTVPTVPFKGAHFATFPPALVEPCILAGSRAGDTVFDPFMGSGTVAQVAQVAQQLGRKWLGCELNPEYLELQRARTGQLGMELSA